MVIFRNATLNHVQINFLQLLSHRSRFTTANAAIVQLANWSYFRSRPGEKCFIRDIHFISGDTSLFDLQTSVFGSTFYVLTGFHGAHVTIGVIWMITLFVRLWQDKIPPEKAMQVEIGGLYWHFVDIVWIVIFVLIYLIP